ncbi:hypothetical protein [Catenuloplanes indicus]|uniref:Membrane channel-forming protein YqfA (Hemolysin III family) n=1 Tax=Catenuloplanes indicus TaxID=137267 RepID=A0AAE3VU81_9ACTN|nr:hypothetical protein [Catenuloplanes indicus]MDQ0363762.1 putative membrane channel-forming protein YqfA (hemolysin III family) [Catenuloplanes indicus]
MNPDDGSLDDETKAAENDPEKVRGWTVTALFLGLVGGVCSLPVLGWHPRYDLSVVAALAGAGLVLGLWLRRAREDDPDLRRSLWYVALTCGGVALLIQLVVLNTLLDAVVPRLDALLLISGAVFTGIVVGSAEGLVELLIVGLTGLVIGGLLPMWVPGTPYDPLLSFLAVMVPIVVGGTLLPLLLERNPGGLVAAGLLAVFWTVLGRQPWAAPAFRPWPFAVLAVIGALTLVRVWFGRWPAPQRTKFATLHALATLGAGAVVVLY